MLSALRSCLAQHPWAEHIHFFDTIESTNTYAKQLALQGAPEGTVIIADHQTGGRGRMGRTFSSPAGMGIYLSVILRPHCSPTELMHLTCATGVYASQAVQDATGILPGIKWTNDLVLGKRKLGGILTELSVNATTGKVEWAIVGIGINCCQTARDFPPEIREIACSLGLQNQDRIPLIAALIRQLYAMRQDLWLQKEDIMVAFTSRCVTIGQEISILRGEQAQHGTALSVDPEGALLVRLEDGSETKIASGEVSIRGMYGYV